MLRAPEGDPANGEDGANGGGGADKGNDLSAEIAALKKAAWDTLPDKVAFWSRQMGVSPTGLKITTARKRYGSCNGKNSLCFSCFLMNSPEEAIDLVVVHELCHIKVRNHGPDFYTLLGQYLPDYQERKKLLK